MFVEYEEKLVIRYTSNRAEAARHQLVILSCPDVVGNVGFSF